MTKPTEKQIREEAARFAKAIGGAVHLTTIGLAESVDGRFPGMTDADFRDVRDTCETVATELRQAAITAMWN